MQACSAEGFGQLGLSQRGETEEYRQGGPTRTARQSASISVQHTETPEKPGRKKTKVYFFTPVKFEKHLCHLNFQSPNQLKVLVFFNINI